MYSSSSNSSLLDISKEWKQKAEETLKATLEELSKENKFSNNLKKTKIEEIQNQNSKFQNTLLRTTKEIEIKDNDRRQWASKQITDIHEKTKKELESIEKFRKQQYEIYQTQLEEKTEIWDKLLIDKRN